MTAANVKPQLNLSSHIRFLNNVIIIRSFIEEKWVPLSEASLRVGLIGFQES